MGTALKTTSLRLRGTDVKVLEEEGLDSEGAVTSKSKLQSKVKALSGVDILTATGEYKSTYEILSDIAKVWESINDMDQAALLELISGKRNSSVIAAILQNPQELKDAYEDAMNAEGSALKENEKYLDSIQGKIDQFNNAVQSMWSNFLDADAVKFVVELGTALIKAVDAIGLLNSAILVFAGSKLVPWILTSITGMSTFGESLKYVGMMMTSVNGTGTSLIPTIVAQTQALWAGSAGANVLTLSLETLGIAFKTLMATPLGWFLAIGAAIALTVHLFDVFTTTTKEHVEKLDKMKSELRDIQSELETVNSELKTTQERMAELIAMPSLSFTEQEELNRLKEQNEELERRERLLKAQEEREKKRTAKQAVKTVESQLSDTSYAKSVWDVVATGVEGALMGAASGAAIMAITGPGALAGAIIGAIGGAIGGVGGELLANQISTEDKVNQEIEEYKRLASEKERLEKELEVASDKDTGLFGWGKSDYEKTKKELEKIEKELGETETYIDGVIKEMGANLDGVEYGYGADEILSFYDNLQYEFEIARGTIGAESDAIVNIFNRPEYESTYNEIKRLQGELEKDPGNQTYLAQISEQCKKAEEDLIAVGLSADKAFDYFTMKSGSSVDDIMAQYKVAKTVLEDLKSGAISIDDLVKYDEEKGEATGRPDAIAEKLQGVAPEVREQFTSIVEAIKEGSYDTEDGLTNWDAAIKKIELQGMQAVIASVKTELEAANKLAFPDLEISGWIDSVEELRGAFESLSSAMDLIVTAQEQMSSSGRISMKTALDLMATTDDWNQILEVNNGVITMNANAEQILIQSKLDLIKANIEMALQQVETDIALMEGAINSTKAGNAFTQGFTKALTNAQGVLVGLKAGWDAFWAGEDVASAFNGAYSKTVDNLTPDESSLGELYKQRDNLQKQREMLTGVDTTQEFKNNYDFDKKPGDKYGEDEETKVKDDWEALINKYENQLALITNERDLIEAEIDKAEARGGKASAEYYEDLIRTSTEEKNLLEEQYAALSNYLEANKDAIDQDTWTDYNNTLNEVAVAIKECESNTIAWQEALREIDIHYFEQATDEINRLGEELEFVNSLLEDEDVADENGNWSSAALTRMAMYTNLIEKAAADTQRYQDEIAKLEEQYEGGELSEEQYQERLATLTDGLYDSINAQNDARDSIIELNEARIDAIKEGIEKEIEAYEDLIDAKKEELDAERDLYDFRKNIKKQTKDISELERRIASLSGSSAASDVAERRRLEAQLMEAKEGLNDTYYDHSRDAQSSALDYESEAYRESQEKRIEKLEETLDNVELLIQNSMMDVLFNADIVYNELNGIADTYGITLSDELTQPWKDASAQAIAWKNELQTSMTSGEYAALIGEGGAITVFANGVGSKLSGSWNTAKTAVEKYANFLTGTELGNKFSGTITGFANQIQKIIDKWNGVKTAADNAYQAQLRVQNVGGNSNAGSGSGSGGGSGGGSNGGSSGGTGGNVQSTSTPPASVDNGILNKYKLTSSQVLDLGYGPIGLAKFEQLLRDYQIKYSPLYKQVANMQPIERSLKQVKFGQYVSGPFVVRQYAKGTTDTPRDEWAITDEPQFGDELVLVPGKDGNLSFVRKGTGIVPADMTQKLFELAQIPTSDLMNKNLTAIVPNITKNDFKNEFNFESLVHVDTVDSDTLPKLEKMVDKKIDDFSKALNYSLKRFAR